MQTKPIGFYLTGIFLSLAALLLLVAGITLVWPGTPMDAIWLVNEKSHVELTAYALSIGILFLILSQVFVLTARGWFKQRKWGWLSTIGIFAANIAGDMVRLVSGDFAGGLMGIAIAGLIIFYLTRPRIKGLFR
jgi:NADH:ubiquinone oxidoreductase subunit 2 (subunit N)